MIRRLYRSAYNFVFGLSLNAVTNTFNKAITRLEKVEMNLRDEVKQHRAEAHNLLALADAKHDDASRAARIHERISNLVN